MTKKELEELDRLSKDPEWNVRMRVAENPNCPIEILDLLSRDTKWSVRQGVAENPNCPIDLLFRLMEDEFSLIKAMAAALLRRRKKTASPEEMELIRAWETLWEIGVI